MSTEQNKALIRRWLAFAEAGFNGAFREYVTDDYVGHLQGALDMDRVELERLERAFVRAFPDAGYAIEDLVAEGDRVVLRVVTSATHRGEFEGIAATNRQVEFPGIVIYRIQKGRIAESWGAIDFGRLMRQLR